MRWRRRPAKKKRLVVLSDGTWQTPENKYPTNILKLAQAVEHEVEKDGIQQIVFYDAGIGTQGAVDKIVGGGLGQGIDVNIMELYQFLALNYDDDDEVYLFGFSRGSYTVRSLAGLIYESGLVRRDQIGFVQEAYDLYRENVDVESEKAKSFREAHGDRIPIKLLACFDTVGSLGLPFSAPGPFGGFNPEHYKFHTTELSENIEHAVHLLSIDEDRQIFSPTLMEPCSSRGPSQLTQKYFPGGHGGVGGGDSRELVLADNSLRFLVDEMKRRDLPLELDEELLPQSYTAEVEPAEIQSNLLMSIVERFTGKYIRKIPNLDALHPVVIKRYQTIASWRPAALEPLREEILATEIEDE